MVRIVDLGLELLYEDTFLLQQKLVALRQEKKIDDTLLFLEHKKVITIGNSGNSLNILLPKDYLEKNGFDVAKTNRGGDVTYHGPGQIVGYFIFNIRSYGKGVRDFFYNLEEIFITFLKDYYNVDAYRDSNFPGVWVNGKKITALGCAIKKGISMHGFGFNVNTDLNDFKVINPCGIIDKGVTSLEEVAGRKLNMELVKKQLKVSIGKVFDINIVEISKEEWEKEIEEWNEENQIG
ncbi:MAG: lipoyl(octanoyl) transferase LipB [Lachnospirales bacterium]